MHPPIVEEVDCREDEATPPPPEREVRPLAMGHKSIVGKTEVCRLVLSPPWWGTVTLSLCTRRCAMDWARCKSNCLKWKRRSSVRWRGRENIIGRSDDATKKNCSVNRAVRHQNLVYSIRVEIDSLARVQHENARAT